MKINRLEDIIVWQESMRLMKMVYELVKSFPFEEKYNLIKHMKACARNIPANIAEGYGRFHYQESTRFNRIARGSLMELKSDCLCAINVGVTDKASVQPILEQIESVNRLLNAFIQSTIKMQSKLANGQ